ncbi:MAG: DUF2256 domain-containing protein [Planctomycetota bacterium]
MVHKKKNLPSKICKSCGRPFTWRAKWARCWEEVKFCSHRCKSNHKKQDHEVSKA